MRPARPGAFDRGPAFAAGAAALLCAVEGSAAAWLYPHGSAAAKVYASRFAGGGYFDQEGERVNPQAKVGVYDSIYLEATAAYPERWNLFAGLPFKSVHEATALPGVPAHDLVAAGDLWLTAKRQFTGKPLLVTAMPAVKVPVAPAGIYGNRAWEAGLAVPLALQTEGSPLQLQAEAGAYVPFGGDVGAYGTAQLGAEVYARLPGGFLIVRAGAETQRKLSGHQRWPGPCGWYWVKPYAGAKFRTASWWEIEVGYGRMTSGRCAGTGDDFGVGVTRVFTSAFSRPAAP